MPAEIKSGMVRMKQWNKALNVSNHSNVSISLTITRAAFERNTENQNKKCACGRARGAFFESFLRIRNVQDNVRSYLLDIY